MELERMVDEVGIEAIKSLLRDKEEDILSEVHTGDIYSAQAGYRIICRIIGQTHEFPEFSDLPPRLRKAENKFGKNHRRRTRPFSYLMYRTIRDAIEVAITDFVMPPLKYMKRVIFKSESQSDLEMARRAYNYAKQFEAIETRFGSMVDEESKFGSKAREVWCIEPDPPSCEGIDLGLFTGLVSEEDMLVKNRTKILTFPSLRGISEHLSKKSGKKITRGMVRQAIVNHTKIVGCEVGYTGHVAEHRATGRELPVRCVTLDLEFMSQRQAAKHFGVSQTQLSIAIQNGKEIKGMKFEYGQSQAPGSVRRRIDAVPVGALFAMAG